LDESFPRLPSSKTTGVLPEVKMHNLLNHYLRVVGIVRSDNFELEVLLVSCFQSLCDLDMKFCQIIYPNLTALQF